MISTRNLSELPEIKVLRRLSQSLALLEAILSPEWEGRCYSFNAQWSEDESLASYRDGSGDEYFLLFSFAGAILKGFSHEAKMSPFLHHPPQIWAGILDTVPPTFSSFLEEPAFSLAETTFCLWRTPVDSGWQCGSILFPDGEDPDGSSDLLAILDANPRTYQSWAEEYYEQTIDLSAVQSIYEHSPLTEKTIKRLNPKLSLRSLKQDLAEIEFPSRYEDGF